jgi:hypothetical protein
MKWLPWSIPIDTAALGSRFGMVGREAVLAQRMGSYDESKQWRRGSALANV